MLNFLNYLYKILKIYVKIYHIRMSVLIIDILDIVKEYIDTLKRYNAIDPEDIIEKAEDGLIPISESIVIYNRLKDIEAIYPFIKNMYKEMIRI